MSGDCGEDYDMTNEDNGGDGWADYEEEKQSPAYYAAIDRDGEINFTNPSSRVSYLLNSSNNPSGSFCCVHCRKNSLKINGKGRRDQRPPWVQE